MPQIKKTPEQVGDRGVKVNVYIRPDVYRLLYDEEVQSERSFSWQINNAVRALHKTKEKRK